jgi:prepilin-type N-terminal cleavage/methylation domain-containing protein
MKKSFTLIEILVVIVIIGILSAFIIVSMSGVSQKATIAKGQAFANSLKNALMINLVSEWKFDELATATNGATIADTWSGGNNGTLSTGDANDKLKTGASCVSGKCLELDGTDDYVDCGSESNLDIINAITIGAWVKTSNSFYNTIVHKGSLGWGSGYWLCVKHGNESDNRFGIQGVDNGSWGTYPGDGRWHYVVGTYSKSEGKIKVYLDGINKLDKTVVGTPTGFSGHDLRMGLVTPSQYPFNGLIDELRIYNAAIPTSQIQQDYFLGLNNLFRIGEMTESEYLENVLEFKQSLANNN